jgi:hypothetical protein
MPTNSTSIPKATCVIKKESMKAIGSHMNIFPNVAGVSISSLKVFSGFQNCSRSRQRAAKADKRMVLVHTHGLFIT